MDVDLKKLSGRRRRDKERGAVSVELSPASVEPSPTSVEPSPKSANPDHKAPLGTMKNDTFWGSAQILRKLR